MNILTFTYPLLIFFTLGYDRRPWLYGFPSDHPKLKSRLIKFSLFFVFLSHSYVAIKCATKIYAAHFIG